MRHLVKNKSFFSHKKTGAPFCGCTPAMLHFGGDAIRAANAIPLFSFHREEIQHLCEEKID
jgi:hypothetical protein